MEWLINNIATIVISLILIAVVGFVVYKMIKAKKSGASSCGCGCADCPMSGSCHPKKKSKNK